jgi:hypothetical protein
MLKEKKTDLCSLNAGASGQHDESRGNRRGGEAKDAQ